MFRKKILDILNYFKFLVKFPLTKKQIKKFVFNSIHSNESLIRDELIKPYLNDEDVLDRLNLELNTNFSLKQAEDYLYYHLTNSENWYEDGDSFIIEEENLNIFTNIGYNLDKIKINGKKRYIYMCYYNDTSICQDLTIEVYLNEAGTKIISWCLLE